MTTRLSHMQLLAFGGPWNEQLIDVPEDRSVYFAPRPVKMSYLRDEDPSPMSAEMPKATYTVEKVGYHFADRCNDQYLGWHTDDCRWTAKCLVNEGYPKHRIVDALNAIVGLSKLGAAMWTGLLPKPAPEPTIGMPWRVLALIHPEFVQWVIARYGPVRDDDDEVTQADYERYRIEYEGGS